MVFAKNFVPVLFYSCPILFKIGGSRSSCFTRLCDSGQTKFRGAVFLIQLYEFIPRLRHSKYTAGSTNKVKTMALNMPPTMGAAMRLITSLPVPVP